MQSQFDVIKNDMAYDYDIVPSKKKENLEDKENIKRYFDFLQNKIS